MGLIAAIGGFVVFLGALLLGGAIMETTDWFLVRGIVFIAGGFVLIHIDYYINKLYESDKSLKKENT